MKKIIWLGLIFNLAIANNYYVSLPYVAYVNYSGATQKDDAYIKGIYFSIFSSPWKSEFDVESTNILYKDLSSDLAQADYTFLLHYYKGYNLEYNFGVHYISSTDDLTDRGFIFKLGLLNYEMYKWNRGINIYYSNYSNLSTSPKILQLSPKIGINFGNYYSSIGSFYIETQFDYIIILKNQVVNDLQNSYNSINFTLNNYNGKYTTTFSSWFGKRAYAVENGGFVVNNLGEEQTGGFKISENYAINKVESLKFEYSYIKFNEEGPAKARVYLLSYNYSF